MEKKYGRIVLTTSGSGLVGNFGQANYGAAKTAMIGLQNVLTIEGAKNNIKINSVSPTADTRMTGPVMDEQVLKYTRPEHVSPAVAWLCSEQCGVSGQIIGAGAGFFCAVHYARSPGVILDPSREISVEDFAASSSEILDFSNMVLFHGVGKRVREMLAENGYIKAGG
jgi:hypothetical protein